MKITPVRQKLTLVINIIFYKPLHLKRSVLLTKKENNVTNNKFVVDMKKEDKFRKNAKFE